MFKPPRQTEAFIDFVNLVLGGFLFFSPWVFGFTSDLGWHTSWIAGTAISILAISSLGDLFESVATSDFFEAEEWLTLTIGFWLAVCPWILGFHSDTKAMQVHFLVGLAVSMIAVVELWALRHPRHEKGHNRVPSTGSNVAAAHGTKRRKNAGSES